MIRRAPHALLALLVAASLQAPAQAHDAPSPSPSPSGAPTPQPDSAAADAPWTHRIDRLARKHSISIVVGQDSTFLYRHKPFVARAPASNEKLLMSMATLQELGPDFRIVTDARAQSFDSGVIDGDLWIVGRGDPAITGGRMRVLARNLDDAGLTKIQGSVRGSTTYFARDWWAPGWKPDFPANEVALPTALSFNFNTANGVHIKDPERRAAAALTKALRARGIRVTGKPRVGKAPTGLTEVAKVASAPLASVLRQQNVPSNNFYAETLGKLLGATAVSRPGTIAKGAQAINAFANAHDAPDVVPFDSSGLSYDNRVTADNVVRLLWYSDTQTWADDLRSTLPSGGQGTLSDRFANVDVRAKTGTLTGVSALSGWVASEQTGDWIEFSILSHGMPKATASHIEDRVVTIVASSVA